jgi:hypothetical protein
VHEILALGKASGGTYAEAIVTAWSADIAEEVIALVEEEVSEELLLDKV